MNLSTQTQAWIHSIIAAFIGAFATAATGALTMPGVFNLSHDGLINFAKITLAPAFVAVFAILKQSPLPGGALQPGDKLSVQNPVIQDGVITGDSAQVQKAPSATSGLLPLALLCLAGVLLTGCHSTSTTTPATAPTLTQQYTKAAQTMADFSADVKQAQQIEISLYRGGIIDKPTHIAVQGGFLQTSQYGKQIDALIAGQAGASTIQAKVAQALQSVQSITLATGTLDANATAQLKATITALTLILNTVSTIFNTTTGELYGYGTYRYARIAGADTGPHYLPAIQGSTGRGWIAV